jgi:hypothetical protein
VGGLLLTGCGGSSGSDGTVNLYQGSWTGPWSAGNDVGTATFHITGLGSVAGQIVDTTTNETYQVTGQIVNPSLNSTTLSLSEMNSGNTVLFNGTLTNSGNFTSFQGQLTAINGNGSTQTINLTYSGT